MLEHRAPQWAEWLTLCQKGRLTTCLMTSSSAQHEAAPPACYCCCGRCNIGCIAIHVDNALQTPQQQLQMHYNSFKKYLQSPSPLVISFALTLLAVIMLSMWFRTVVSTSARTPHVTLWSFCSSGGLHKETMEAIKSPLREPTFMKVGKSDIGESAWIQRKALDPSQINNRRHLNCVPMNTCSEPRLQSSLL